MNRRLLTILLPAAAATLVAGCSTFDTDVVAQVGDETLTTEQLDQLLLDVGQPTTDGAVTRQAITSWIANTTIETFNGDDAPATETVSDSEVAELYGEGIEQSGIACISVIVTETADQASDAAARIEGGEPFAVIFDELNINPALVETRGDNGCVELSALDAATLQSPIGVALLELSADAPVAWTEVPDPTAPFGFVVARRAFDELTANELATVTPAVTSRAQFQSQIESLDISVDPRYGQVDPATLEVIAL